MSTEARRLRVKAHSQDNEDESGIEEDQDTVHLGLRAIYIHIQGSFKAPLQSETLLWKS